MDKQNEKSTLVYCVVRYGQIVGCYAKIEDALQIQKVSIEKGAVCDLIVKPLLNSLSNG